MTEPIDRAFNVCVLQMADRLFPTGFDVGPNAPDTFEALKAHIARTGRMLVWDGASDATIFGDPEVNYAFRAWHDWCHLKADADFSKGGEKAAADVQKRHIRSLYGYGPTADRFCRLVDCEVVAQGEYAAIHGEFPKDQMAFARDYLTTHVS